MNDSPTSRSLSHWSCRHLAGAADSLAKLTESTAAWEELANNTRDLRFAPEQLHTLHEQIVALACDLSRTLAGEQSAAGGGERVVTLGTGSLYVVPRGTEHKPIARPGYSVLMLEPTGTTTVGDRHDEVPDYVDITTGHTLEAGASGGSGE